MVLVVGIVAALDKCSGGYYNIADHFHHRSHCELVQMIMPNRTIYHHAVAARERAHEFLAIAEACADKALRLSWLDLALAALATECAWIQYFS